MRKDLGKKNDFLPLPVTIIGTYDEQGKANAMNAAWAGVYDTDQVIVSLSVHKTTENLVASGAFTMAFATKDTLTVSDYFGIATGKKEDKIAVSGVHVVPSTHVHAPIITEYPLVLECKVDSFEDGILIGTVVNTSVDEKYLGADGKPDIDKMGIITFDTVTGSYRELGPVVGKAWSAGLVLKK